MDGSGAAIMFMHAGGKRENIHWVNPGEVDEELADSPAVQDFTKQILLVDVCPSNPDTIDFLEQRGNFTVLDHHLTAEKWADKPGFIISVGNLACGTEMFRRWLSHGGMEKFDHFPYRKLAELIDDHDRWVLKTKFSIEMPRFFAFAGQQEFTERFYDVYKRFDTERESYWTDSEVDTMKIIQNAQDRRWRRVMQRFQVRPVLFDGEVKMVAYVISGEVNCSELLNKYLKDHPEVDAAVQLNFDTNKVSIRSVGDKFHSADFCGMFAGGGHKNAAGHPIPEGMVEDIIRRLHG